MNHLKFFNNKNKPIGDFVDGIFYKRVKKSKHFMRIYSGYGIDKVVLDKLKDCKEIRILEEETDTIYATTPELFREKGIERDFDTPQVFLPLKYFRTESNKQKTLGI